MTRFQATHTNREIAEKGSFMQQYNASKHGIERRKS